MRFSSQRSLFFAVFLLAAASLYAAETGGPVSVDTSGPVSAETGGPVSSDLFPDLKPLSAETSFLRDRADMPSLARLLQLQGDYAAAAAAWRREVQTGAARGAAFFNIALCEAAVGEWETARADLNLALLSPETDEALAAKARSLLTAICGFEGTTPPPSAAACYILWKKTGKNEFKERVIASFPQSPEAKSLKNLPKNTVRIAEKSHWLLFSGRESVEISEITGISEKPRPNVPYRGQYTLQTGLFTRKENAENQAQALAKNGFSPEIQARQSGGKTVWAVHVNAFDANETLKRLKTAGFEAFQVK